LRETVAVGVAEGGSLAPDIIDRSLATIRAMPLYHVTSMCNDLVRGNRLELP
jgi:ketopantoate reductase